MGKCCCTLVSKFQSVFKSKNGVGVVLKPFCKEPVCLPRPPKTIDGEDSAVPVLTVSHANLLFDQNGQYHRTSRYELMNRGPTKSRLVVRRGQEFFVHLTLSRVYDPALDAISLIFTLDGVKKPHYGHGTLVAVPVLGDNEISEATWQANIENIGSSVLRLKITPSPNAIIGKWKMEIDTKNKQTDGAVSFTMEQPIYVIFNPWNPADQVYLENEEEREEYVLNEDGLIWRGSYRSFKPTIWKYMQFAEDILDCALYLMVQIGGVRICDRHDVVAISRALSAAVNQQDDYGALAGNWSNEFGGGTAPTKWIGSQSILQQYWKTKKPVKYGQCWVFAGVLNTVCRTLGIPCRVVTNFASAHDTQNGLTVDYFIDDEGRYMEEMISDSIWNFHVWNEAWMTRVDLGDDCNGWQVIDATPQELSERSQTYCCGPSSVKAIKRGDVLRPYDSPFIFAEVNADKVYWRYNGPTQPLKLINKDTQSIGQFISTKAVGKWAREDITLNYKYPETSKEERDAMHKALRQNKTLFSRYYLNEEFNDVVFNFELRDDIIIGQPFSVLLQISNRSDKEYEVSVILTVETVMYYGSVGDPVKKLDVQRFAEPRQSQEVSLTVNWEEYGPKLLDQCAFNISCLAAVKGTNFEYFAQDDFRVRKPDIKITMDNEPVVGQTLNATAKFRNPLPIVLRKGKFVIEGPGLERPLKINLSDSVDVNSNAECTFSMVPKHQGRATIAVKFYSTELDDVDGFINFMVKPSDEEFNRI